MKSIFAIVSIVMLLLLDTTPNMALAANANNQGAFKISAQDGSTQELATIDIHADKEFDKVVMQLPSNVKYDRTSTNNLLPYDLLYDEDKNTLTYPWAETKAQKSSVVLYDLEKVENEVKVQGFMNDELVAEEVHSFKVPEDMEKTETKAADDTDKTETKAADDTDKAETKATDDTDEVEPKATDDTDEVETKVTGDTDKSESTADKKKSPKSAEDLEDELEGDSSIGDLNQYIGIGPVFETALTGADADFRLTLKLTGAKRVYKNVNVTIDLPITEYITFNSSQEELDHLAIDSVSPTYNVETNQLTYHFE